MTALLFDLSPRLRARLRMPLDIGAAVLRMAAGVVDLLVRLSLAKAFFEPGMLPGFTGVDIFRATWPVITAQVAGPNRLRPVPGLPTDRGPRRGRVS